MSAVYATYAKIEYDRIRYVFCNNRIGTTHLSVAAPLRRFGRSLVGGVRINRSSCVVVLGVLWAKEYPSTWTPAVYSAVGSRRRDVAIRNLRSISTMISRYRLSAAVRPVCRGHITLETSAVIVFSPRLTHQQRPRGTADNRKATSLNVNILC